MQYVCTVTIDERNLYWMQALIRDNYKIDWVVDDLPAGIVHLSTDSLRKYYSAGFPIGYRESDGATMESYYVYNHVSLVVQYRRAGDRGYGPELVVTGFEAYPRSIQYGDWNMTSNTTFDARVSTPRLELALAEKPSQTVDPGGVEATHQFSIPYTYSIYYVEDSDDHIGWLNRWDRYLDDEEKPRLWLATTNSLVVALLTSLLAAISTRPILGLRYSEHIRILRRFGIQRRRHSSSNDLEPVEAASRDEMARWKLVHRDVFRIPSYGPLLAPLVGSGMQLFCVVVYMYYIGGRRIFNPASRGTYINWGVGLFVVCGLFSGYHSSRLYKSLGGHLWRCNLVITGIMVPGLLFTTVFIINLFIWVQAGSTAIPFGTFISLLALWLGVQLPMVYLGGLYGHKRSEIWEHPIEPSSIPRRIPQQPWYLRKPQFILLAGVVPCQIIFIEQVYVFNGLLPNRNIFHNAVVSSGLIHVGLFLSVSQMSIIGTWLQLSSEVCSRLVLKELANSLESRVVVAIFSTGRQFSALALRS